jgi:hypothetical protein
MPAVDPGLDQPVESKHPIVEHRVGKVRGHRSGHEREVRPIEAVSDARGPQGHEVARLRVMVNVIERGIGVVTGNHRRASAVHRLHSVALLLLGRSQHRKIFDPGHAPVGEQPVGAQEMRRHKGIAAHWHVLGHGPLAIVAQEAALETGRRCGHHAEAARCGRARPFEGRKNLQCGIELGAQGLGLGDDLRELHLGGVAELATGARELRLERCQRLGQGLRERALLRIAIGDHIEHARLARDRLDGLGEHHHIFGARIGGDRIDAGLQGGDLGL